jgi:protein-tyrosine phosphatase
MIDIHCHILPGLDDGPQSLDESRRMARFCVRDGITHVVATPHCHRHIHLLRADILPAVRRLNADFDAGKIPLTVLPGSEIQVTDSNAYRREFDAGLYCHLGDRSSFTLLEFNWAWELFPNDALQLIEWIRERGTIPILAHPERHEFFAASSNVLQALVSAGAWVQVTADSLLGNHGPAARSSGETILKQFREAVLATDAHNMTRCSGLSAGYDWADRHLGSARAADLRARAETILAELLPTGDKLACEH